MAASRNRWYAVALVLLAVAAVAVVYAVQPSRRLDGTASTAGGTSATNGPTVGSTPGPTITVPSTGATSTPTTDGSTAVEPPPDVQPDGALGTETAGDPYYPDAGNGGYDVTAYQVTLGFDPATNALAAATTIAATVTEPTRLGRLSFDLQPSMKVSSVTVDGLPAGFGQQDAKLRVTPVTGLAPGASTTVVVTYGGSPARIVGGTAGLADGGWYTLDSGGAVVIGEPFSASAWYPVNEVPTDRASFAVTAEVPDGWKVISNGLPVTEGLPAPADGTQVFGWAETSEMASYLSMIYIDTFTQTQDSTAGGLPIVNAYAKGRESDSAVADRTGEYLDFLASKFGPYPFGSAGGIYLAESLGFAMETQTRPIYSVGMGDPGTVVHELAHQWFGDDVTITRWADICLNECFASYASWLWTEHNGTDLDAQYRQTLKFLGAQPTFWSSPLYDMGAGNEFGSVYTRGPLALHALRHQIGEEKFNELLLSWIEENSGKSASWADFEALVNTIAGTDETPFMQAWFHATTVPADEFLYPGDLTP
ncbi:MAG: M1 family metallopeptidase [Nakamurella sp.]